MNHATMERWQAAQETVLPYQVAPPQLQLQDVGYTYRGGKRAVSGMTLNLAPGILGLLGPNGAGKSTLMRMLATLAQPTSGRILWNGEDIAANPDPLRCELGYLPQDFGAYPSLTAREFLRYMGAVKSLPQAGLGRRVDDCLELVGLQEAANRQIGSYSGGMRQRVGIAQALLNDPKLLIVDEPTVGLDPEERLRFRNLLTDLSGRRLVILSTHIVSDIEASATALAVMVKGRLCFNGVPEALLHMAHGKVWEWTVPATELPAVRAAFRVSASLRQPHGVRVRVVADQAPCGDAHAAVPGLEDAYMYLLSRHEHYEHLGALKGVQP
jgi:ABC-2 type transport system ATP-binding protein